MTESFESSSRGRGMPRCETRNSFRYESLVESTKREVQCRLVYNMNIYIYESVIQSKRVPALILAVFIHPLCL
jgi:hypothetical protein